MKAHLPAVAVLTISLAAWAAHAQGVYRCGNDYGQARCPEGKAVQVDDARTAEQKKVAEDVALGNRKTADAMEKARLAQEAKAAPAVIVPASTRAVEKPAVPLKKKTSKKKKDKGDTTTQSKSVTFNSPGTLAKKEKKVPDRKRKAKVD